jgi:hypothetical protein
MAASAVYVSLTHISLDHSASRESFVFTNISATTAAFNLMGGRYGIVCMATGFGTVTLQVLAGDNSTYLTAATAISANGVALVDLPAGTYKFAIA